MAIPDSHGLAPLNIGTVSGAYSQLHYGHSDVGVSNADSAAGAGSYPADDHTSAHNDVLKHHLSAEGGGSTPFPRSKFARGSNGTDSERARMKGVLNSLQFQPIHDTSWIAN
jgi:hypothetical protein